MDKPINLSTFIRETKTEISHLSGIEQEIKVKESVAKALEIANSDQDPINSEGNRISSQEIAEIKGLIPTLSSVRIPSSFPSLNGYLDSLRISAALKKAEQGWVVDVHSIAMAKEIIRLYGANRAVLDIYEDWCGPCKRLDKDILSNENYRRILTNNRGIVFKIDRTKMSEEEKDYFRARSLPQLLFLNVQSSKDGDVVFSEIGRMNKGYTPVTDHATDLEFSEYVKELIKIANGYDSLKGAETNFKSAQRSGSKDQLVVAKTELGRQLLNRINGDMQRGLKLLQEVVQEDKDGRLGAADAYFLLARSEKDPLNALEYYLELYRLPHHEDYGDSVADNHARSIYDLGKKTEALNFYLKWIEKSPLQGFSLFYGFISAEPDKISWVRPTVTKTVFRNIPIDLALKAAKEKTEKNEPLLDVILVVGNSSQFDELKRETAMSSKQEAIVVFVDEKNPDYEKVKKQYGNGLETPFILRLDAVISSSKVEEKVKIPPTSFTTLVNFYSQ